MANYKMLLLVFLANVIISGVLCATPNWCENYFDKITPDPCHIYSKDDCAKHPDFPVYEEKGGICNFCDACIKYVDIGGDCKDTRRREGLYEKCKDSVCDYGTRKCVAGSRKKTWCDYYIQETKCATVSENDCAAREGFKYEKKGDMCEHCDACVKYSGVGESCENSHKQNFFFVKCKSSVCNRKTYKCENWHSKK